MSDLLHRGQVTNIWVGHRRLKSGTWQIRFRTKNKKETSINLSNLLSEKEVLREKAHYEREIDKGNYDPWNVTTLSPNLSEAVRQYISEKSKTTWNPNTAKGNKLKFSYLLKNLPNLPVNEIKDWHWYERLDIAPKTKKGRHIITKAFLNWCVEQKYITHLDKFVLYKQTKTGAANSKGHAITLEELEMICDAYRWYSKNGISSGALWGANKNYDPERHIHLWHVLFWMLFRTTEVFSIKAKDVGEDSIKVIGKGQVIRYTDIIEPAREHIDWFADNQIPGKPFFGFDSEVQPRKLLNRMVRLALGDDYPSKGFHMFRHGGITHMLTKGVNFKFVSEHAGHADPTITLQIYNHVIPNARAQAFKDLS